MKPSPLQLERHFFTKIHLDAHPDGDPAVHPQVQADVDLAHAQHEPRLYQLTLRLKVTPPPDKKSTYTAEVHVVSLVRVSSDWPEDKVHQLVEANGAALIYGAAREMLCNLTARGPWPMLCLHSVSFVHPKVPTKTQAPAPPTQSAQAQGRR